MGRINTGRAGLNEINLLVRLYGLYKYLAKVKGARKLCVVAIQGATEEPGCLFEVRAKQMPGMPVPKFARFLSVPMVKL